MNKKINIAIDGFSACGKSTLSKALAEHFSYLFIDTGAMYRAIALHALRKNWSISDFNRADINQKLANIDLSFIRSGVENFVLLNGENVASELRSMEVAHVVSAISSISEVRQKLLIFQQNIAKQKGVVMDGRDIGTSVLPDAEVKLFLTATIEKRTLRRYQELILTSQNVSIEEVRQNLIDRDFQDSHRKHSPLRQAEDAVILDNTNLSVQEQFLMSVALIEQRIINL